jgi:hypothetical protein
MKCTKVVLSRFSWIIVVLFFVACGKKSLSPKYYVDWVENENNGLSLSKEFNDVDFQILYKPINYIVAKEYLNGNLKKENISKRLLELGNMQYFTLRIKSKSSNELLNANISNENEYYQRLEYFMGPMQDDIKLIENNDTIPCAIHHFERSYGLAPYNNFVIAFASSKINNSDKYFVFEDKILGTGTVTFKIKQQDINNIPNLVWK